MAGSSSNIVDGFDFPLGPPDHIGYAMIGRGGLGFLDRYDYQGNGTPEYHPGEDWNEAGDSKDYGRDNNDFKDPVYAIANGKIIYAKYSGLSWGYLVLIEHNLPDGSKVWSQYAHLYALSSVIEGATNIEIKRGYQIGLVGDYYHGTGRNIHLHFEIRKKYRNAADFVMNWSKSQVLEYYHSPTDFINANRPVLGQTLRVANENGKNVLSWDKSEDKNFERYEIYRSMLKNGTDDPKQRTLITNVSDQEQISFEDADLTSEKTYYYKIFTYYKNGKVGESDEVSVFVKRQIIQITTETANQTRPVISGEYLYWQDERMVGGQPERSIYRYNLKTGENENIHLGSGSIKFVLSPNPNGTKIPFYAYISSSSGYDVFYYDLETKAVVPVSISPLTKDQYYPVVSDDGIIIWQDLRNGDWDLYMLDTKNSIGSEPFVVQKYNQINPRIWGNKVIWKDSRDRNSYDIYIKELGGEVETKIVANTGNNWADVWDNFVVWEYKSKLNLYNLETGEASILVESNVGANPKVRDGKIAYAIWESETSNIHIYDIADKTDIKIDFPVSFLTNMSLWQNLLAFEAAAKETPWDGNIYLTSI